MKFFLTDQTIKFDKHLKLLMEKPVMTFSREALKEKTDTITLNTKKKLKDLDLTFFFDYQIFPPTIMASKTQWEMEKRKMKVGDTIVQQVYIPPVKTISQKIIFGVRVNNIIDEQDRKGFSYQTLEGHVEKGESIFTIEQTDQGIIFKVHTFSAAGNLLARLAGPFFSRPYQAYCTRRCLTNVKFKIENEQ